jgi:hypothetical protein
MHCVWGEGGTGIAEACDGNRGVASAGGGYPTGGEVYIRTGSYGP